MIEIKSEKIKNSTVTVPGSKSYTHRFLIAAALADGVSTIYNGLVSEDTLHTLDALTMMGIKIYRDHDRFVVHGGNGFSLNVAVIPSMSGIPELQCVS
jgi:3-phosphoshikimate 1-carboxyvinyltransferase